MRRAGSILRKHRAGERVYLPSDSRDNQYILAEIMLTDELLNLVIPGFSESGNKPYQKFYQTLSHKIFEVVEEHGLSHVNFIANNKLARVRYSGEQQVLHTEQQSFFFYCPEHNSTFKSYFDGSVRTRKVKILFLATGEELRLNSGKFHSTVVKAIADVSSKIGLDANLIKVRDHQHLTFDVFAKEKGLKDTITHSFREIADRYDAQGHPIRNEHTSITYAIASIPMARRLLKGTDVDYDSEKPFEKLYQKIESAFQNSTQGSQLNQIAFIGSGVTPFVRYDQTEGEEVRGELMSILVNPDNSESRFISHWDGEKLVDTIRFIYIADDSDEKNNNYGTFVNQVIQAVRSFADEVSWKKADDDITVRVHQHTMQSI